MPLYLSETDVASLLTPAEAVPVVEDCFRRLASGACDNRPRTRLPLEGGYFAVMAAADSELGYAGLKSYTLVDGAGARLSGTPAGYAAALFWLQGLLFLALVVAARKRAVRDYFARHWRRGFGGGLCLLSAYAIVLWAMTQAPIAAIAALRETSVIFAALAGSIMLKERFGRQRLIAACAVVLGIFALRG